MKSYDSARERGCTVESIRREINTLKSKLNEICYDEEDEDRYNGTIDKLKAKIKALELKLYHLMKEY